MKTTRSLIVGCAALLLVALLTAGCQTVPKVQTETKPGVDFSKYHTFALLPLQDRGPGSDPGLMLRVAEPARQAVVETLTAKGFRETTRESADFCVHLHGQSVPKVDVTNYGYSRPVITQYGMVDVVTNPDVRVDEYEERTLSVEILDNQQKGTVWVGWMKRKGYGQIKTEKVTEAIRQILAEFPPGTAPSAK